MEVMLCHYSKVWFRHVLFSESLVFGIWGTSLMICSLRFDVFESVCLRLFLLLCHAKDTARPFSCLSNIFFPEKSPQVTGCLHGKVHVKASINCLQVAPHDPVLNEQERQMLPIFHFKSWRISKNIEVFCKTC